MHQPRYTVALTAADVGERVMVRHALPGDPVGGPTMTDAVGDLVAWRDGLLHIATRQGEVAIAEETVVASRRVPPRRVVEAMDASVADLQRLSALGWQSLETERMGGWRLRAGGGFTGRANSVLPLGDPGLPVPAALEKVERWYGDRGLLPRFQLPQPDTAALAQALAERGWQVTDSAEVMVGTLATEAAQAHPGLPPVVVTDQPSPGWLDAYHYRGGTVPPIGLAVLTNHHDPGFASVSLDGEVVAIARGAVDEGWLGVTAVEVIPSHRRRGLARHVMAGLFRWGQERSARLGYLQVAVGNEAGKSLYLALGFAVHHRYDYRVPA